ncbi:Porin family protein [Rhodovastum atsumiense]|uniref:Porin family protein n=1 Tax=Rhodovastum atsumiense TaxID=504468 RepID=A0A5M6ISW3_9PROT|nr:outer membrane beta-barrel protein [Rhodovastum atsumiense]KAA5611301.1 porin family protein [Rhodovastum atsumiense]CAH2601772.1 Porin family protein [Rhodovastum atsumiense]
MRRTGVLLALTAATLSAEASGQTRPGSFISMQIGPNLVTYRTIQGVQLPSATGSGRGTNLGFEPGIAGTVAAGQAFGDGLRAELEASVRSDGFAGSPRATGTELKLGVMANLYYDFDVSRLGLSGMVPYLGGGIGWMRTRWNDVRLSGQGLLLEMNDSVDSLALQGMTGAAFPITDSLSLTTEYRFTALPMDQKFATRLTSMAGTATPMMKITGENNHAVLLGMRYSFGNLLR